MWLKILYLGSLHHSWYCSRDVVLWWNCCCWSCGFRMLDYRHYSHGSLADRLCFARLQTFFIFAFFGFFLCVAKRFCDLSILMYWFHLIFHIRNKKAKKMFFVSVVFLDIAGYDNLIIQWQMQKKIGSPLPLWFNHVSFVNAHCINEPLSSFGKKTLILIFFFTQKNYFFKFSTNFRCNFTDISYSKLKEKFSGF